MKRIVELEDVVKAYNQLKDQENQVTVKNIIAITGGSTTTVSPLLRSYEAQLQSEKTLSYSISAKLRNAYITDIHAAVIKACQDSAEEISALKVDESNLLTELKTVESRMKVLADQLATNEQTLAEAQQQSRTETAKLTQQITDLKQHLQHSENDKDLLQKTIEQGKSKMNQLEMDQNLAQVVSRQAEQRSDKLQSQNEELRQKVIDLDKQVAIYEERLTSLRTNEQYKETIKDLKEELVALRNTDISKHSPSVSQ